MALHASDNQMIPTSLALLAQNSAIRAAKVATARVQKEQCLTRHCLSRCKWSEFLGFEQLQRFVASDKGIHV